ncbi:lipocalin family protein [Flavobacterium sp. CYK-4]|uniref:lipocalin family protein n=1 Tax=Flavobacterium lotistagni TaxID=2709660 RepID=UPI0014082A1E|nr:lipocalin family protein [Flavobacterium lotistagni]NHM06267.1 lipocalin family protein [Flavobacterium lotistagni]
MKKVLSFLLVLLVFSSCQKQISASDLSKINGYWEIEKVVFDDGNEKQYTINEVYDFFEVKDNKGFRKKVMPQLDGTFLVNDTYETIVIENRNGSYFINCSTDFAKWKEEIIKLNDKELVLRNPSKKEYHYKRAAAINLLSHGKKAQ